MHRGYTKRWRRRWEKGYHKDLLLWAMMDYFIDHANWEDKEIQFMRNGVLVETVALKRGQHLFTISSLAALFSCTRDKIRVRLRKLSGAIDFIHIKTHTSYSIATVLNYNKYQSKEDHDPQENPQATHTSPTGDPQVTHTPNNYKEYKEKEFCPENPHQIINAAIEHLNEKAGVSFNPDVYITQSLMVERIGEGATLRDFKLVINKKCSQWLDDPKMAGNLRPVTLFAADKFEGYLQEAKRNGNGVKKKPDNKPQGIELMMFGLDVLVKFGENKFKEFCNQNRLGQNDIDAIRMKAADEPP